MAFALPSRAYDLQMLDRPADRARDHRWVYGVPPGITSEEWPLDPVTGYPLMHGFTLLLPEDYRVHGEDIVAVSFFATAPDHNDGGAPDDPEVREAVMARTSHPRLSRMTDILDYEYAALLLTRAKYEGAFATPPAPLATAERRQRAARLQGYEVRLGVRVITPSVPLLLKRNQETPEKSIFDFLLTARGRLAIIPRWVRFSSICPETPGMVRVA